MKAALAYSGLTSSRAHSRTGLRRSAARSAFVLVAVLVVVVLTSMVAVSLLFHLKAEETAATATASSEQAWAAAMAGVYEAMRVLAISRPGDLSWRDNPAAFRSRLVADDGVDRWYFTVFAPADPDAHDPIRYGLTDEASRAHLNKLAETNLLQLPGMTPALAQAILDFVDADWTARPDGAEQPFYDQLPTPYAIPNGPLQALEELLLVRGMTPALFFGEDANQNFQLDPNEDDGDARFPPDNRDGRLDLGLRQYLTVWSYEYEDDDSGAPRIDLNDPTAPLPEALAEPVARYILALRTNKVTVAHPAELLEAVTQVKDPSGKILELASGVGRDQLPMVLDLLTARTEYCVEGLINVNTAPVPVLATVPGLDVALAEAIVSARRGLPPERRRSIAWLYQEGVMDAATFKRLAPYLTARSFQFTARVVGYGLPSGRYRVLEALIDRAEGRPVVVSLRDLTRLGLPLKLSSTLEVAGG